MQTWPCFFSDSCLEIMYHSTHLQYSSILYINKSPFRKQLWDRCLSVCLSLSNRRLYFPVNSVHQVTHLYDVSASRQGEFSVHRAYSSA
jgi:hypothetical protein